MADSAAQKACSYILNRIQTDPDLRYYAGPLTETFHLLCVAQAEYTGQPLAEVEEQRRKDLQPEYRKRDAEVLVLLGRIQELEARLIPEEEHRKLTGDALHAEGLVARMADALEVALKYMFHDAFESDFEFARNAARAALRAAGRLS